VHELAGGQAGTAAELSKILLAASGLDALRVLIDGHFLPRAQTLKARSAIAALRDVARAMAVDAPDRARALDAEVERAEASIAAFAELRAAHLVLSGSVVLSADEVAEVERVTAADADDRSRLAVAGDASSDDRRQAALVAIGRWRTRGSDPRNDSATNEVCETLAHLFEAIYVAAV
jgi:hypothetical protein